VGPTTETYKFIVINIKNPTSTQESDPFTGLISYDKFGYTVQVLKIEGPRIINSLPGEIIVYNLDQGSLKPAEPTTYTISFTPKNPIPPQGSIQLSWPN